MATYTVKPGDTLSAIGAKYGIPYSQITGYRSGNPNLIYPGEVLTIPSAVAPVQPVAPALRVEPIPQVQPISPNVDEVTKIKQQIEQVTSQIAEKSALLAKAQAAGLTGTQQIPDWVNAAASPSVAAQIAPTKGAEATAFAQPTQSYDALKQQKYQEAGLADIKARMDALDAKILASKNKLYGEEAEVMDNPWLSNASRVGRVKTLYDMANKEIGNLLDERKLLADDYTAGISEIDKSITAQLGLEEQQRAIAQQQLEYQTPEQELAAYTAKLTAQAQVEQQYATQKPEYERYESIQGGLYDPVTNKWIVAPKETTEKQATVTETTDAIGNYIQKRKNEGEGWATIEAELREMGIPTYTGSVADKLLNKMFGGGTSGGGTTTETVENPFR